MHHSNNYQKKHQKNMYKFVGEEICQVNDAKILDKAIIWIIEIKATL
jgi:hypothetical protein